MKPWETETDLDALFLKIKAIEQDGLVWKEEYKKEPIAYGIHKLIVGCVCEDEKISIDDLQDEIAAFEDYVQSVDIAAFNKIWTVSSSYYITYNYFTVRNVFLLLKYILLEAKLNLLFAQ